MLLITKCSVLKWKSLQHNVQSSFKRRRKRGSKNRKQKAKAFAKLEELNRRKLIEIQTQKLEWGAVQFKQEERLGGSLSQSDDGIGAEASALPGFNSDTAIQACEDLVKIKESMGSSSNRLFKDSVNHAPKSSASAMDSSVHLTSDASSIEFLAEKFISQFPEGGQNQKQRGCKRKQNASHERNLPEKIGCQ